MIGRRTIAIAAILLLYAALAQLKWLVLQIAPTAVVMIVGILLLSTAVWLLGKSLHFPKETWLPVLIVVTLAWSVDVGHPGFSGYGLLRLAETSHPPGPFVEISAKHAWPVTEPPSVVLTGYYPVEHNQAFLTSEVKKTILQSYAAAGWTPQLVTQAEDFLSCEGHCGVMFSGGDENLDLSIDGVHPEVLSVGNPPGTIPVMLTFRANSHWDFAA